MDPDVALKRLREAIESSRKAEKVTAANDSDQFFPFVFCTHLVIEAAEALDQWLSRGGFLPCEWSAGRPSDAYSGYTNRESWALHLWLTNDEPLYDTARAIATGAPDLDEAIANVKYWVEEVLWEELCSTEQGRVMTNDVGSLWRVNWKEVTEALRAD